MSLPRLHSQRRSRVFLLRSRRPCVPSPASGPHLWSQGKVLHSLWACRTAAASVACRCTFFRVLSGFFFFRSDYYFSLVLLFCEWRFALWWAVCRLWECRVLCCFWGDLFSQVWAPTGNKKFETLSYLPPLTNDQIAKQIDYMLANNSIPCLEFDLVSAAVFLEIALCRLQWWNGSNDWPCVPLIPGRICVQN
jgi:hypothetical protein